MMPTSSTGRRLPADHAALSATDTTKPPPDSILWKLWDPSLEIAERALQTQYMQGIRSGSLNPNEYGQYTLQDFAYCDAALQDYQTLEARARVGGEAAIASFAAARIASYKTYDAAEFGKWGLVGASAIVRSAAADAYITLERSVANWMPPIYGCIAMIPCDQLWPWLAEQVLGSSDATPGVYGFWPTDNASYKGAYRLGNFVDAWSRKHPGGIDFDVALWVYQSAMTCEENLFRSACGQELVVMPEYPRGTPPP